MTVWAKFTSINCLKIDINSIILVSKQIMILVLKQFFKNPNNFNSSYKLLLILQAIDIFNSNDSYSIKKNLKKQTVE